MRWLLGTIITLAVAALWVVTAVAIGLPALIVGHVGGVICAAGSTISCGGRLWAD